MGHRGGERSAVTVHCGVHSGSTGEEMENHRALQPSSALLRPRQTEAECSPVRGPAHTAQESLSPPRGGSHGSLWTLGPVAHLLATPSAACWAAGTGGWSLSMGGASRWAAPEPLSRSAGSAPSRHRVYKAGRAVGAHCWLNRSLCSCRSLLGTSRALGR